MSEHDETPLMPRVQVTDEFRAWVADTLAQRWATHGSFNDPDVVYLRAPWESKR